MFKLKFAGAVIAAFLPCNWMRVLAYRLLLGYKIEGAQIGFGTLIAVTSAKMGRCRIGLFNQFLGPMRINIADSAKIGDQNKFICGLWTLQHGEGYARRLEIGEGALITSLHYFDVCGSFELGAGSWIAGIGSQFWTHGAGVSRRYVSIGRGCYIGSAVRFSPGASIGDEVAVTLGSVVSRKFAGHRLLVGGAPATVIMSNYDWKSRQA
jgi:acetyltransferase-like isoleucine patch superfamily enzyme